MNSSSTPSMLPFGATPAAESTFPVRSTANREAAAVQAGFAPVPEGLRFEGLIPLRPAIPAARPALAPLLETPVSVVPFAPETLPPEPADLATTEEDPTAEPGETENPLLLGISLTVVAAAAPETAVVTAHEQDVPPVAVPAPAPVPVPRGDAEQAAPTREAFAAETAVQRPAMRPSVEGSRITPSPLAPAPSAEAPVAAAAAFDPPAATPAPIASSPFTPPPAGGDKAAVPPTPEAPNIANPPERQTVGGTDSAPAPTLGSAPLLAEAQRPARDRQVPASADGETDSSQRTADVAGLFDDATAVALPNQGQGWKKLLLDAYKQQVKSSGEKVGIKDAKAESAMSTLLSSPFLSPDSSAPVAPVAEVSSSFPAEWVEKLAQLTSRAERLAPARLEVSLPMEGARDLRVRVSCRGGRISCEFHNVSSEMQRTFMREWPGLSQLFGRDSQLRVEQPSFVNVADPQQRSDGEPSHRRQRDERSARNEDADIAAFFTAHRLSKSETGTRK